MMADSAVASFQVATTSFSSSPRRVPSFHTPSLILASSSRVSLHAKSPRCSSGPSFRRQSNGQTNISHHGMLLQDYVVLVRPLTLVQAIGAFIVGCLSIHKSPTPSSVVSIYFGYAAGMIMNDIVDRQSGVDALHVTKKHRAIASGRISVKQAWAYCALLSVSSCCLAATNNSKFLLWSCSNLAIMMSYALGLQNVLFLKNILVGYLGISPLVGAILLGSDDDSRDGLSNDALCRLGLLAMVGMAVGVARELLKDIEDTRVDQKVGKLTVSNVYSPKTAHRVAFGMVWTTCLVMLLPIFRNMFAGPYYLYSWTVGTTMIIRAAFLPVKQGQRLLKKSIYVLLAGMVAGFVTATNR